MNRVPDLNDVATRVANGLGWSMGDFVCDYCDTHSLSVGAESASPKSKTNNKSKEQAIRK